MAIQPFRLDAGGRIDRARLLRFRWNGRPLTGHPGDTLASALLANGVHVVARSPKHRRPRGIVSAGIEEPNALVQLGTGALTEPNARATQVELHDGLDARSQSGWPSLDVDLGALPARLAPPGFAYRTAWPPPMWTRWERVLGRRARHGRAPASADPRRYEHRHAHCDVLVVGAGPAGLAAALAAGRTGARVILADEQMEPGGRLLTELDLIDGRPALAWVDQALGELRALPETRVLARTTITGYYDHNFLVGLERVGDHLGANADPRQPRERLWKIRAAQVVLATGAIERPLVFPDNDRPAIMLAGTARAYVNRFAVAPGSRAVVVTTNDDAYRTALDLAAAGIAVAAVADLRPRADGAWPERARAAGIEVVAGATVNGTRGTRRVRAVRVSGRDIACDLVCMSGGWLPAIHLFSQSRGRVRYDDALGAFVPGVSAQAERSAGTCAGAFSLGDCLAQGAAAGAAAARAAGFGDGAVPPTPATGEPPEQPAAGRDMPAAVGCGRARAFVDFQTDVTVDDIGRAASAGFSLVEHLKRYTSAGTGPDQGKTGGLNTLAVLAELSDASITAIGHTTFRPPYVPLTFGALAGRDVGPNFDPVRQTPMHAWHETRGAVFENVGQWKRPWYYPVAGETMGQAVAREVRAARASVGLLDASTLGKIDVQGPDAARFLDRIYASDVLTLAPGRCRYGLMLGQDGMVMDDGVLTRLGEHHFLVSTTTGNAGRVLAWLEEWRQTEWPDLHVYCTSVTEQYAVATVVGPQSRELLTALTDLDLDRERFPFMTVREGRVAGVSARVFRVSFTGELSYEVAVPASRGPALWEALLQAGRRFEATPYGTEAMHVLRCEKGYIIVGQDTDGTVTPLDLGMAWMIGKDRDYIGRRSLRRADTARADRKQLVGLLTDDPAVVLPEGAQIVAEPRPRPPMPMVGHVTSSYWSPTLGRSIALALVVNGRARLGEALHAPLDDGTARVTLTAPRFFDPLGTRLHG
jgi:sarcosine oxidase subunit alpha